MSGFHVRIAGAGRSHCRPVAARAGGRTGALLSPLQAVAFAFAGLALLPLTAGAQAPTAPATPEDSIILIRTGAALRSARGSGFVIGDGSWVATAAHVVSVDLGKGRRANDPSVQVYSAWTGSAYTARVVAVDGVADVALLRLPQAGFPALPLEGLDLKDAEPALQALKDRPLRLFGFPLSYGEDTVAALAHPEHNDSNLREIARRGETSLCVLNKCPDAQPGWSGGPMVSVDRGTAVAVFHSLYRPKPDEGYPAGTVNGYLGDLLRKAGAPDLAPFAKTAPPTLARPKDAGMRLAHQLRSLSWSANENWEKVEEEQRELLKLAPDDLLARVELGRALLMRRKDEDALTQLQEAVRRAPESVLANMYLGKAFHANYDPKAAIAALRKAMACGPEEVEPPLVLAQVYSENQRYEEAEATLRETLQKFPGHPTVLVELGVLLTHQRKEEEGLKLLAQGAELAQADPALSFVTLAYARALDTARKVKEAEVNYRNVVRQDPTNANGYYFLAQLFLRSGRLDDAQVAVNNAIRLKNLSDPMLEAFRNLQLRINEKGSGK